MKGRLTGIQNEVYEALRGLGPATSGEVAAVLIKRDRNKGSRWAIRRSAKDALHLMEKKGFVRWASSGGARAKDGRWIALDEPVAPRPKPLKNTVQNVSDFAPDPDWLEEQMAWVKMVQERMAEKKARRG